MSCRMKKPFSEISDLARKGANARVAAGTHNLLATGKYAPAYKDTEYSFEHIETGNDTSPVTTGRISNTTLAQNRSRFLPVLNLPNAPSMASRSAKVTWRQPKPPSLRPPPERAVRSPLRNSTRSTSAHSAAAKVTYLPKKKLNNSKFKYSGACCRTLRFCFGMVKI